MSLHTSQYQVENVLSMARAIYPTEFLFFNYKALRNVNEASLIAQLETPVQLLGREDPLEEGLATHSNILGLPLWLSW